MDHPPHLCRQHKALVSATIAIDEARRFGKRTQNFCHTIHRNTLCTQPSGESPSLVAFECGLRSYLAIVTDVNAYKLFGYEICKVRLFNELLERNTLELQ